eukprot:8709419-Pyramimonas_sp.AAC.1
MLRPSCDGERSHGLQRRLNPLRGREGVCEVGPELCNDFLLEGVVEAAVDCCTGPLELCGSVR